MKTSYNLFHSKGVNGLRWLKRLGSVASLGVLSACGLGAENLMTFEMTFQLISDCSQSGSNAVQCEATEDVVKAKETGTWFLESRAGKTFILTNHLGEVIKGVGPFVEENGSVYQARKYEEEVDTGDGCHTYTDELYNLVLDEEGSLTGELTVAQTGGSAIESADCGVLWANEIKYDLKGTKSDELVPARE
ncbi:MAG: hypothetical protein CMH56_12940 [Myxococcales bacterium]|mgnify:CR=1 FL=1|nr:hypothetical protein [Myxococcales bacterium]